MRFAVIVSGVSFIIFTSLASAQETKTPVSEFVIIGSVFMSNTEPDPKLPRIPITFDPHFQILVKVEKVLSGNSPWAAGTSVVYIIHSPARTFHTHELSGQKFVFTFSTEVDNYWCKYCLQDARTVKKQ